MSDTSPLETILDEARLRADPGGCFMTVDARSYTYAQLHDRISRLYRWFELNLAAGGSIAVLTRSPFDLATILLAALRAGHPIIVLNFESTASEIDSVLEAVSADHVFADQSVLDRMTPDPERRAISLAGKDGGSSSSAISKFLRRKLAFDPLVGLDLAIESCDPIDAPCAGDQDGTALLLLTSGSTSAPKIVQLSRGNIANQLETDNQAFDYDSSSRILCPLPLHFTDGLFHGPILTYVNSAMSIRPAVFRFDRLGNLLDMVGRHRATHLIAVPAILAMIQHLTSDFDDTFDTPDFRYIRSSGDALPTLLWQAVQVRFGVKVVNTYGLSEAVCESLFSGPSPDTFRIGTAGKALGCKVRIVDTDDKPVQRGVIGELQIAGESVMTGYLNQPDLTAATMCGRYLRTGDLASIDSDGYVSIHGRKSSVVVVGGINVYPEEVRETLLSHPSIADAVVFGVKNELLGEIVAAAVLLDSSVPNTSNWRTEVTAHCRVMLSDHKIPSRLVAVNELPRNAAGKLNPAELEQLVERAGSHHVDGERDVVDRVLQLAACVFKTEIARLDLTSDPASTVGWDSMAHIELILEAERVFSVKIDAREILAIDSLARLVSLVESKLNE